MTKVLLKDLVGDDLVEEFSQFDLTEIQNVLKYLENENPIDLAHAEMLQQKALRGADILTEYLGKLVKTVSYFEGKLNSVKNKVSLEYQNPDGGKTTTDMKIWAANCSPEVDDIQVKLSKAKASKMVLEKKYDILIKVHHFYKEIATGMKKTILGYTPPAAEKIPEGWE